MKKDAFAISKLTKRDLEMAIRGQGKQTKIEDITLAVLETNGDITVLDTLSFEDLTEISNSEGS